MASESTSSSSSSSTNFGIADDIITEYMTKTAMVEEQILMLVNKVSIAMPSLKEITLDESFTKDQQLKLSSMWHSAQESVKTLRDNISMLMIQLNAPTISLVRNVMTREMELTTTLNSTGGFLRPPQTFSFTSVEPAVHVSGYTVVPHGNDRSYGPPVGMSPFRGSISVFEAHNNKNVEVDEASTTANAAAAATTPPLPETTTTTTTKITKKAAAPVRKRVPKKQEPKSPPVPQIVTPLPLLKDDFSDDDEEYEEVKL